MDSDEEALAALELEVAKISDTLNAPLSSDATIRMLKAKLAELEAAREKEKTDRYDLRRVQREKVNELEQLKLRIRVRKENELKAAKLAEQFAAMDALTKDAVWRTGTAQGFKLYAHQLYGAHFIAATERCIIADGMGLGKTGESIAGLDMLGAKKVVIICPGDVMSGFYREMKMWSPSRAVAMIGRKPKEIQFQLLDTLRTIQADQFCIIVNYEAWRRNGKLLDKIIALQPDSVIIDEAHNIKEMSTNAFKGVKQIVHAGNVCPGCNGVVLSGQCTGCLRSRVSGFQSVKNLICMTGTPILNKPGDIFPLLHLINPEIYYNKNYFLMEFCYSVGPDEWVWKSGGASALAAKLQGFYLRRTIEDTDVVLPPQDLQIHDLEINEEDYPLQCEIMNSIRNDAQIMIKNAENEGKAVPMSSILAAITRERQACVWPGGIVLHEKVRDEMGFPTGLVRDIPVGLDYQESIKMDYSVKLIQEMLDDGHRIVVFSQFRAALSELQRRLVGRGISSVEYHGGTAPAIAEAVKTNFDRARGETPRWDIVLAHYRKGGVGLNFTAATQMIILDGEWNPGKEDQAYGRINRIGQTEENTVHIIRIINSIDDWLSKLVEKKRNTIEDFDLENSTYAELRELLMR